ncbi:N-acetylmuramoyl-L-alanine amidase [Enterococcus wangshanyuanii]|uniref:Cell wall amidase lytH n=1 Tax=Enterococcus wangshanyuanii TaxID=2005703 RepID=A0ABQ1P9K5_9ENTE|nr:N-acetylmuramoyl-L-alanine amidase [Enterococcus wangshanyuanii]GGC93904.1 putative cell wall amidase lytH [Enterococcus wangshanyuanii]
MRRRLIYTISIVIVLLGTGYLKRTKELASDRQLTEDTSVEALAISLEEGEESLEELVQIGSKDAILYSKASIKSTELAEVNRGELIELIATEDQWYQVVTNAGDEGYVSKNDSQIITRTKQKTPSSLEGMTIVLNPGHGGDDTGAISNDGWIYEKEVTLETAEVIKSALEEKGSTVILTRDEDIAEDLSEICTVSQQNNADLFISLHYDSSENMNEATGTTTYYYYEAYADLAEAVNQSLSENLPLQNRGIDYGNYQVLRENTQPALLLELGYMNSDYDLEIFNTEAYQMKVANALIEGVSEYLQKMERA